MDRVRAYFQAAPEYIPVDSDENQESTNIGGGSAEGSTTALRVKKVSRFDYAVFLLLGISMLWSWNCFLAAAAYFQMRFEADPDIRKNFLPSILAVSTGTTFTTTVILSNLQSTARYSSRIVTSLIINIIGFAILALSTILWTGVSPRLYLAFLLLEVLCTSFAAGMAQNGLFAFVSSFDPIFAQAIMTGQGVAGILPAIAQIITVLAIPSKSSEHSTRATASPKSAFAYFLTATAVSLVSLLSFSTLLAKHRRASSSSHLSNDPTSVEETNETTNRKRVSLWTLFLKLKFLVFAVFTTFAVTMTFPVFTQAILSNHGPSSSRLFQPDVFIPLGFVWWNTGDFLGRLICAFPALRLPRPRILALLALSRVVFIPLYFLCNVSGHGAVIKSDVFYFALQVAFGLSNGWLGSNAMMAAPEFVNEEEKSASGGFMGLWLVGGLAVGSALSFLLRL